MALSLATSMGGCSAKGDEVKVDASPYAKPAGWQAECVGRWLVDVPPPVDLGASYFTTGRHAEFFDYTPRSLRESTRSRGGVSIGPVAFTESDPLVDRIALRNSTKTTSALLYMASRLSDTHRTVDLPDDAYQFLLPLNDTQSAWAGPGRFQISLQSTEDQRGRFYWKDPRQSQIGNDAEKQSSNTAIPPSEEPLAREALANLVPRYSVRKPGQVPSGPGVCTPHGFFSDPAAGTERDSRVSVSFVDPRYANLAVHVEIATRMPHNETALIPSEDIRKALTPWDAAEEIAREHKKRCRSQQGTAGGGIFSSCSFAGATGIGSHWDVQYLKLANGQEARAMAITYPGSINGYKVYEAIIETAGKKASVTEPRIVVTVEGFGKLSEEAAFRGKEPPSLQEAFKLAVTVAKSLRPRPQAIDPAKPVVDPWVKFRR